MNDFIPGNLLERVASMRTLGWIQFVLATPVVLVGRVALLRSGLAVDRESQPEHVHADWSGRVGRIRFQRYCKAVS